MPKQPSPPDPGIADALVELYARRRRERGRYWVPCGKLEEALKLLNNCINPNETYIVIITAGNGVGKTTTAANLAAYLCDPRPNPYLDTIQYLKSFPRPNQGRIITTPNAAKDKYAEKEIPYWFPTGAYEPHRDGHSYDVRFKFGNGSKFDLFTFERDPKELESSDLNWAIIDEPMPAKFWGPLKSRFRTGGVIFYFMTALYESGWVARELENSERLGKDVFKMKIRTEDACKIHGVRGHLPHEYIEQLGRESDEDERAARLEGEYISLSGMVYKQFDPNIHMIETMPSYHQECYDKGKYTLYRIVDPHDRKPFAIGWYAVFPNDDVICLAEWPDFNFYKAKHSDISMDEYRRIMLDTDKQLDHLVDINLNDPNFGNTPKLGSKSFKQIMAGPCAKCFERDKARVNCPHSIAFLDPPDDIHFGHSLVKGLIGNPGKNIRPKIYFMSHCKNHLTCMLNYTWDETKDGKGLNEKPRDDFKDFADLVRYGALFGFKFQEVSPKTQEIYVPKTHGKYIGF